ncbi:MAG: hypothetical protein AAF679_11670 [Pseudomonadota bacterium]
MTADTRQTRAETVKISGACWRDVVRYLPFMRWIFLFLLLPTQVLGWTFTSQPLCTVSHENDAARIDVIYDPVVPEYRLKIALTGARWAPAPVFSMAFDGGRELMISTDRHATLGPNLMVQDRGFGNVLDGLEFNQTARALTDQQQVVFSLSGAAEPVRQFRACVTQAPALS